MFDRVSGFLTPDAGAIRLNGLDVTSWAPEQRSWAGLGRSFQDARLFPSLTVLENVMVALERHLAFRDQLAVAVGLPEVAEAEQQATTRADELTDLLGLGPD